MNSGVQLFSDKDQASAYAKYRPTYPDELYTAIYDYAGPPQMGVALDVATGASFPCSHYGSAAHWHPT